MMVKEELGEEWLSKLVPFRCEQFGEPACRRQAISSSLQKEADGHYQSADYFSND